MREEVRIDTDSDGPSFIAINKPVWAYGLEEVTGILPLKGARARRIAFAQLATPGAAHREADNLGLLARGLPLWLAETMYFSKNYTAVALIGSREGKRLAPIDLPWSQQAVHQLAKAAQEAPDFVVPGSLTRIGEGHGLSLDVWDLPKSRHRRQFSAQWTPGTADTALVTLQEHFRLFMEWTPNDETDGLAYKSPGRPSLWIETLDASLSLSLAEKAGFDRDAFALPSSVFDLAAEQAFSGEAASLAWLTLQDRSIRLGKLAAPVPVQVYGTARVKAAQLELA